MLISTTTYIAKLAPAAQVDRTAMLVVGLIALFGGLVLMVLHLVSWLSHGSRMLDLRDRRYYQRQFFRRTACSSLMAIIGALIASMYWATQPRTVTLHLIAVLVLLLGTALLALADMISIALRRWSQPRSEAAQRKMLEYYQDLQRKRQAPGEAAQRSTEPPQDQSDGEDS